ncbi:GNAT family protein [Streptomyces sp. NPDC033754]|uniref:GNAT family N-acetyltransferase n=1 Tax=unclassified Streptomyces TaxID=2593676 RepID=UPI0033C9697B
MGDTLPELLNAFNSHISLNARCRDADGDRTHDVKLSDGVVARHVEPQVYVSRQHRPGSLAPEQANISYGLHPAWRGRGLVTRAVLLICRYAAAEGVTQGVIRVDPENSRSAAVARRSGFTYDKRVPEADGNPCDRYVRNLTADRLTTPRPR